MLDATTHHAIHFHPLTLPPETSVLEALDCMKEADASCVLVVDETHGSPLVGLFAEGDAVRLTLTGADLANLKLLSAMTRQPMTLKASQVQGIGSLLAVFRQHRVRHLPILDDSDCVLGLVTESTVLAAIDPGDLDRVARLQRELDLRQQAEQALEMRENRLQLQQIVLLELSKCPEFHTDNLKAALQKITQTASHTLDVERVSLWFYNGDRTGLDCADLYELNLRQHSSEMELQVADVPKYVQLIESGKPIVADLAQHNPRIAIAAAAGTIASSLDVPIRSGGKTVGVLCLDRLGRPREWMLEEQNFASYLAYMASLALEARDRKQAEAALQYRLEFEQLIANISTQFINLNWDEVDGGIASALQQIGEFAGVDRSYVFQRDSHGAEMSNTHEWCAAGIEPQIERLQKMSLDAFPWLRSKLQRLEVVHIPNVTDLSPDAALEKDGLLGRSIQSLLCVPMVAQSQLLGFVGFDLVRTPYIWTEDSITLLRLVGEILANALERKRVEETLRLTQFAVDRARDLVFWLGSDARVLYANDAACRALGYSREELSNLTVHDIYPDFSPQVWTQHWQKLKSKGSLRFESRHRTSSGESFPVETAANYLEFKGQESQYAFVRNISDRKRAEAEVLRALQKERELSELKSRFVTMTSHEFRTPLAIIKSSAQLLERYEWTRAQQLEQLQQILSSVQHMTQLLNDVLALGQAEAGKLEFHPVPLELTEFCSCLLLEIRSSFGGKHTINLKLDSPEGKIHACMDGKLLRHILDNLLANAIKYSPPQNPIQFTLSYYQDRVVFQIQDEGIGIPTDDLPRLFESFHRAKNVGTIPGTGLGLAIVQKCIELHGGTIAVTSQVDIGTTFQVTLPLNRAQNHEENPNH